MNNKEEQDAWVIRCMGNKERVTYTACLSGMHKDRESLSQHQDSRNSNLTVSPLLTLYYCMKQQIK